MPFNNLMQAPGNSVGMVPPEYQQQQMELQRKRALAQALAQGSMTPLQSRPAGRFVAAPTPLEAIAKLGQAYFGSKMGQQADTAQGEMAQKIAEQRRQAFAAALSQAKGSQQPPAELGGGPAMPSDTVGAMGRLAATNDPFVMQMGAPMVNMQFKAQEAEKTRQAREAEAAANREQQALEKETARQYRLAQEERDREFRKSEAEKSREFRTDERKASEAFRAQQAADAAELRKVLAESARSNKPLTEFQGRNLLFGARMIQADKALLGLEDKISTVGLAAKQGLQNVPLVGGMAGAVANTMLSDSQQRVEQAQRDFVNAVLRQESGAVINKEEFDNARKQYFPQPGDGKDVIEQKRKNRQIAIQAFRMLAGPGAEQMDQLTQTPRMPAGNTPQSGIGNQPPQPSGDAVIDFNNLPKDRRGR